ncbi:MAG TPA: hypothetical protein PLC65_07695, partial [Bacteroidia bacterium]|nr:hypothetical protein [Bacteroidia bacterium]
ISLIQEAYHLLNTENELSFKSISKNYYVQLLIPKNGSKSNLNHILHSTILVLKDNLDYAITIFDKINSEIARLNGIVDPPITEFKILNGIIGYYYIELIKRGFSKPYLYYFFRSIFFSPHHGNFAQRIAILKTLTTRESEKFTVIVGIQIPSEQSSKITILNSDFKLVKKRDRKELIRITNDKIKGFFEKYKNQCLFYQIEVFSLDYYSAIKHARNKLQVLFDTIHMGHSDVKITIIEECAEIGTVEPKRAGVGKIQYYLDGYYKSEQRLYDQFLNKITNLKQRKIHPNAISKINSGLRYLRLGFDSSEIENKLLNYWIGLEYLFSQADEDSYTVGRIRQYYKKCHAIIYFKRNLKYLHDSIKVFNLDSKIAGIADYLNIEGNYNIVIAEYKTFPLLAYRANSFLEQLNSTKKTRDTIEKHQMNLDWNLNRIYRLRNEIVHNASIQLNIEAVTSHLRYYLVFILNGLMDYFINQPVDLDNDGELTIDDYFIMQEILLDNIYKDEKYQTYSYLIKMHNPVEYLS